MSRIVRFAASGGPEVLTFADVAVPEAGPGEVRIQVKAIGINRAEAMFREDAYIEHPTLPARLGYEAAGIIDSVGEGVTGFAPGDAVNTIPAFSMNRYGMYGEVVLAPVHAGRQAPAVAHLRGGGLDLDDVRHRLRRIDRGRQADAGGCRGDPRRLEQRRAGGDPAHQSGRRDPDRPDPHRPPSASRLLDAGARHVIATEEQDFVAEVLKLTGGKGARVVFDPVGGPTFLKLMSVLAVEGIAYLYGALSDEVTPIPVLDFLAKRQTIKAHNIWLTSGDPLRQKKAVDTILKGLASGGSSR